MDARTIRVGGLRVRVVEVAPRRERDDPVFMIHGLGGWAENWREIMPAVADSGRRAIAVDLPGFGESERPRRSRYFDPEKPFYAPFVFDTLDALGIEHTHVAGHSLGGAVAYTAAMWRPDRVRSLTLAAPGGLGREIARELRILTLPGMGLLARIRRSERVTRQVLYSCFHDPARCPEPVVAEAIRYGAPAAPEMVRALRSAVTFRGGVRDEVRLPWIARAGRYGGPALILWGREDRILPVSLVDEARRMAPQAEVRIIPSCGHLVMVERPREMLDALLPFLDRAVRPPGAQTEAWSPGAQTEAWSPGAQTETRSGEVEHLGAREGSPRPSVG
ncbi:MAG: alpha/beta fold hydrolase [Chloroflexi bacterium]|nr:alpha/beta fold hydrolase [Chloroflexota bacterium]